MNEYMRDIEYLLKIQSLPVSEKAGDFCAANTNGTRIEPERSFFVGLSKLNPNRAEHGKS